MHEFAGLSSPPDRIPFPPVETRPHSLPFGELTWENFERLCFRLASRDEKVAYCSRYGRAGQAQQGIDLFIRFTGDQYDTWQVKRYEKITVSELKTIVKKFREGDWFKKSKKFVLALRALIDDVSLQLEIDNQTKQFLNEGVEFLVFGGDKLSDQLRQYPDLIDDFFGRNWVKAFLGQQVADELGVRVDGEEFALIRKQLRSHYISNFHVLEIGISHSELEGIRRTTTPSLLGHYTQSDVFWGESDPVDSQIHSTSSKTPHDTSGVIGKNTQEESRAFENNRRLPVISWLTLGEKICVTGEPGSGKSMLLKSLALDLLIDQTVFPNLAPQWGALLPLYVSFSTWTRRSADLNRVATLNDVVNASIQSGLTADLVSIMHRAINERRVLLLVDGMDEWSDEQNARTTLQHILTFVSAHQIPIVATARPRGLAKIGGVPSNWKVAELAHLTLEQQKKLVLSWMQMKQVKIEPPQVEHLADAEADQIRFFSEISKDRRVERLASNPLLLVGLVTLFLSNIRLPNNKTLVIKRLLHLLIEDHPKRRATEAGEISSRFENTSEENVRREALSYLAFEMRKKSGGGNCDMKWAKKVVHTYFSEHLSYSGEKAQKAVSEILSANSEMAGLLCQNIYGELGFLHGMFEEFLAAEQIQAWSWDERRDFVSGHSAEPMWRSVILNLLSLLTRQSEIEELITVIEKARSDCQLPNEILNFDALLTDIGFSSVRMKPNTSTRLFAHGFSIIEQGGPKRSRTAALKSAFKNSCDDDLATIIDSRIARWMPLRNPLQHTVFEALATWSPSEKLYELLRAGLHDENRSTRRSAAAAIAQVFGPDKKIHDDMVKQLSHLDVRVVASSFEALSLGWTESTILKRVTRSVATAIDLSLRLLGIAEKAKFGTDQDDLENLLDIICSGTEVDYSDQDAAQDLLSKYWIDDSSVVDLCLQAVQPHGPSHWLRKDCATKFLLECSYSNPRIVDWIKNELSEEFPFSASLNRDVWDRLIPFAKSNSGIRDLVCSHIKSRHGQLMLFQFANYIPALGGDELRDTLIEFSKDTLSDDWCVRILLDGWSRSDPVVNSFFDDVLEWNDERLNDLASSLPQLIVDRQSCRARLLQIARTVERPRFNSIARGLHRIGCGIDDSEVTDMLVSALNADDRFQPLSELLEHWTHDIRVRDHALKILGERDIHHADVVAAYKNDLEILERIAETATPLPTQMRGELIELASSERSVRPKLEVLLAGYDREINSDLKIAASIVHHRQLLSKSDEIVEEQVTQLLRDIRAIGPDFPERRAAAFAGLIALDKSEVLALLTENSGSDLLRFEIGSRSDKPSEMLAALMCERWPELVSSFGRSLSERIGYFGTNEYYLWNYLAPYVDLSATAKRDFLQFCKQAEHCLGSRSLQELARFEPGSDLLLEHCLRHFQRKPQQSCGFSPWEETKHQLDSAYLLRDNFASRDAICAVLKDAAVRGTSCAVTALAIIKPDEEELTKIQLPEKLDGSNAWLYVMQVSSAVDETTKFAANVYSMLNRIHRDNWDFQTFINKAVIERLQRDSLLVNEVTDRLYAQPTASEIASIPRYLQNSGFFDEKLRTYCISLLKKEQQLLARTGYDAIEGKTRTVSMSLLDVLSAV